LNKYVFIAFILLILSNCGPRQDEVEKIVEDGVEVIINHLEPYKIGDISSFHLEEIFKIDTEEDEISNLGIPDILGFEISSLGEIFILRTFTGEGDFIFKFNSSGKFVTSFGPRGQGPGEFQNPHHIALDSEDNIVIIDSGRPILIKYDKDGVFIDDYEMPNEDTRITSGPKATLLVQGILFDRDKEKASYSFKLKLLNHNLEVIQVIDKLSFEISPVKIRATEPLFCWSASLESIFVANEERGYEIWVYDSNGKLIRKIRKEYTQLPVSENYKEKILKPFPVNMRNVLYFPEFQPPLQSLAAADNGKLLVSTYESGNSPGEFMCDIFNEDGVFIGRKSLNIWIWEGHLWAKMTADKFYCLTEKDSGYKALYVYNVSSE